jgi:hypothetical protein
MAQQPRFGQSLSENIPPLYSISSEVRSVTGPKNPAIAVHAIRPLRFRFSLVSSVFRHGPIQGSVESVFVHDADDIWAVKLPIEFEVVSAPVHTVYYTYNVRRIFL